MTTAAEPTSTGGALSVHELIAAAVEKAGADDFGSDSYRVGLDVLVNSLNTEAALNDLGVGALRDQIIGYLVNRLNIEKWYSDYPEIDHQEIVAPLFGLGLPRTGSTALSYLLAQDPARRSLRVWEAGEPTPPPETATEHTDPRIATAQAGIDFTNAMFTGFAGMLPSAADGTQECLVPLAFDFRSQIFEAMAMIPTYSEWLATCDMTPAYRYHKRVLKLLQWRCPPDRWSLKTPSHMLTIDALNEVYPDARFVMTHRDVGKVLPSVCALYSTLSAILTERPDPLAIGAHNSKVWQLALRRLIEFRDNGNEDRFHDLSFEAVQREPIEQIARLYAELGDELSDLARERMSTWWTENNRERTGPGKYQASDFGLDLSEVAEQFAFYYERFDVPH